MFVELWLKTFDSTDWVSIDLGDDTSISLNKSFEEIEDFTTRSSSYTKTFNVPQTANNDRFFSQAFLVNSASFENKVVVDAVVKYGGADVFNGQARLASITNSSLGGSYEIFLTQTLPDFAITIQNIKLIDLDYSNLVHTLDYDNIVSTWSYTGGTYTDYTGLTGTILYPLAHYGYNDDVYYGILEDSPTGFTNSNYGLTAEQFAPWVSVKYLIDKIFDRAGFTYDSEFFDSEYFNGIFALAKTNNTTGAKTTSGNSENANVFLATTNTAFFDSSDGTNYGTAFTRYFLFDIEQNDPLNIFTPSLNSTNRQHFFTTAVVGEYKIKVDFSVFLSNSSFPLYLNVGLKDLDNGAIYGYVLGLLVLPTTNLSSFTLYFNQIIPAGRRVGLFYSRNQGGGNFDSQIGFFRSTIELLDSPTLSASNNVLLNDNLPSEISCLDFFKGIVELFNLVVIPSGDRNFRIEKWDTYFSQGEVKNWSQKLDVSNYSLRPTNELQQEYIVRYSTSQDRFSQINRQDRNQEFGTYRFISNQPYHTGIREVIIPFEPLPIASYNPSIESNVLIPHIYTWQRGADTLGNEFQPLGSNIRLGFYNGLLDFTITGATKNWYIFSGITGVGHTTYPAISHLSSYEYSPSTFSDLNIGNQYDFWQIPNDTYIGYTSNDVWNNFWAPRVQPLYDTDVKILKGNFKLTPTDVNNLQFNDRVYFLDAYWRLLNITDADITQTSLVQAEWIKLPYFAVETDLIPPTYEQSQAGVIPTPSASTFSHNVYIDPDTFALCNETAPLKLVYSNCSTLSAGCSVFSDTGAANPIAEGTLLKVVGDTTIYQVIELGLLTTFQNC